MANIKGFANPLFSGIEAIKETQDIKDMLLRFTKAGNLYTQGLCYATGLSDGQRDVLCASIMSDDTIFSKNSQNNTGIILCPDEKTSYNCKSAMTTLGLSCEVFPLRDFNLYCALAASREWEQERLRILRKILKGSLDAVICVPEAALSRLPEKQYVDNKVSLKVGESFDLQKLIVILDEFGYVRNDIVEGVGQYATRGDILDVFVPDESLPVRIEFFGDEIDCAGKFDIMSQRRVENVQSIEITPIFECVPSKDALVRISECIEALLKIAKKKNNGDAIEKLLREKESLESGNFVCADKYIPLVYENTTTLFDYAGGKVFIYEPSKVLDRLKAHIWQMHEDMTSLAAAGVFDMKNADLCLDGESLKQILYSRPCVCTQNFSKTPEFEICGLFEYSSRYVNFVLQNLDILCEDLKNYIKSGYKIEIMARSVLSASEISSLLSGRDISNAVTQNVSFGEMQKGFVYIIPSENPADKLLGFECTKSKFVLFCDGGESIQSARVSKGKSENVKKKKGAISSYLELNVGDFVVHETHGIGIYEGIKTLCAAGITRDYITIKYAGSDCLYVPCDQLSKVSKFSGKSENVKISRMGSQEWTKTKARVKKAAKEMAKKLITLYAERKRMPGYAFSPDSEWQREFEERFEFEETSGQIDAVNDIKADMEKPYPMDRLLCGDVGFGKTEVALRAVFKCISDGKQAAILVPTTVLCWQHYTTVLSRMKSFPVNVAMLSRYVSAKKAKETLRKLKEGNVDVVIGTHKLLSKDVEFKNLGLLVVDEEQRFGVAHKERLKEMSKQVDVLTLSATPIPRTFNMALVGIRDMSVLEEAPVDRQPVQTYVLEHDELVLIEAMKKELRRAGQVFYIHNRVEDIEKTAAWIKKEIPEANIGVAHGKMTQEQLSDIWKSVVDGEIDILVCTTIVETGIDVPNANTMIIEDADRMGLSQLHQIRGRVGRSSRRAYAYFTYRKSKVLSEVAEKRLSAIKEFTQFGAGFKIAMRDLEIRGAGNLLGAEQSGHMESVGYDMFVKILERAVLEEKGEAVGEETPECSVDLKINAYIPEKYIRKSSGRIEMYKRIAAIATKDDAEDVRDEMLDRYGEIPKEAENLIRIALIKRSCERAGIVKLEQKEDMLLVFPKDVPTREITIQMASKFAGKMFFSSGKEPYFAVKISKSADVSGALDEIFKIYSPLEDK